MTGAGRLRVKVLLVAALCLVGGLAASRVVTRPPSPAPEGPVFPPGAEVYGATLGE